MTNTNTMTLHEYETFYKPERMWAELELRRLPLGEWGIYQNGVCVRIVRITTEGKVVNT